MRCRVRVGQKVRTLSVLDWVGPRRSLGHGTIESRAAPARRARGEKIMLVGNAYGHGSKVAPQRAGDEYC